MTTTDDTAASKANNSDNDGRIVLKTGVIFVARHGERMDYAWRDYEGRNWVEEHVEERPWDPPLTEHGRRQGRALGQFVAQQCREFSIEEPVSAIYSSPLLRCCMTAREAAVGMATASGATAPQKVKVEEGLLESLTGDWFKSWCLEGVSDGSWGGGNFTRRSRRDLREHIHPKAKQGIESLLSTVENIQKRLFKAEAESDGDEKKEKENSSEEDNSVLDSTYRTSAVSLVANYRWGMFEKQVDQMERLQRLAKALIHRPESTILLVSHGGPVTHWFEGLFPNKSWHEFGHAKYASCSMYRYAIYQHDDDEVVEWEGLILNSNSYLRELNSQYEEEMETSNGLEY